MMKAIAVVQGLDNYRQLFDHLSSPNGAIKIYCEVSQ